MSHVLSAKGATKTTPGIPPGLIVLYSGAAIPTGWVLCDGQVAGQGDIAVPDLRDCFVVGTTIAAANYRSSGGSGSPSTVFSHAAAAVGAHSAHAVGQPSAHSAHGVTQADAHSAHAVTQASAHSTHAANATHTHEAHGTGIATAGSTTVIADNFTHSADGAHTHDAHGAHSGAALDAHGAHSGATVDAHSAHSGAALDAHSAHSVTQADNHAVPKFYRLVWIMWVGL